MTGRLAEHRVCRPGCSYAVESGASTGATSSMPQHEPPPQDCEECGVPLAHEHTVSSADGSTPEREYYRCPNGCGQYVFDHQTRRLTHATSG